MKIAFTETVLSSIEIHAPYAEREDESFMGVVFVDRHEILQRVAKSGEATSEEARAVMLALEDIAEVEPPREARSLNAAISKIASQLAKEDAASAFERTTAALPPGTRAALPGASRTFEIAPYTAADVAAGKVRLFLSDLRDGPGTLVALQHVSRAV